MKTHKLQNSIVMSVVTIVMVIAVLIPMCQMATDNTVSVYNNTDGIYAKAAEGTEAHIVYTFADGEQTYTVNGENVPVSNEILFLSNRGILKSSDTNPQYMGMGFGRQDHITLFEITIHEDNTISYHFTTSSPREFNGTWTDIEWCFYASDIGDYRSIKVTATEQNVYVSEKDDIYSGNWIYSVDRWFILHGTNVNDNGEREVTANINLTPVDGVNGAYTINASNAANDITFEVTKSGNTYTIHPDFYIIPAHVVGEKVKNGIIMNTLFSMIPILIIAAVLLAIMGEVIYKRYI